MSFKLELSLIHHTDLKWRQLNLKVFCLEKCFHFYQEIIFQASFIDLAIQNILLCVVVWSINWIKSFLNAMCCHWWVTHKFWFTAPINIAYTTKHKYVFKDGYFFTVAPGYYKANEYGIRLRNVFEVIDTHDKHFSGAKFLAFRVATLVPFETKLIDRTLLSFTEVSQSQLISIQWFLRYFPRLEKMVEWIQRKDSRDCWRWT